MFCLLRTRRSQVPATSPMMSPSTLWESQRILFRSQTDELANLKLFYLKLDFSGTALPFVSHVCVSYTWWVFSYLKDLLWYYLIFFETFQIYTMCLNYMWPPLELLSFSTPKWTETLNSHRSCLLSLNLFKKNLNNGNSNAHYSYNHIM